MEITSHVDRVIDLDFNFNSSLLISCSVDKACYIHNVRNKGQKMQKLTFCDTFVEGQKIQNLLMKGCRFSPDSYYIYTMSTMNRKPCYVNKYEVQEGFPVIETLKVHTDAGTGMSLSSNGSQLLVQTNGGAFTIVDTKKMEVLMKEKKHNLPVTSSSFLEDSYGNIRGYFTASADYSYSFEKAYFGPSMLQRMLWLFLQYILLVVILSIYYDSGVFKNTDHHVPGHMDEL